MLECHKINSMRKRDMSAPGKPSGDARGRIQDALIEAKRLLRADIAYRMQHGRKHR